MATQDEIRARIARLVEELFPSLKADAIRDDLELTTGGGVDSMGFLTLAVHVQKELEIVIPFDRYRPEEFTVFGRFVEICREGLREKAGSSNAPRPGG